MAPPIPVRRPRRPGRELSSTVGAVTSAVEQGRAQNVLERAVRALDCVLP